MADLKGQARRGAESRQAILDAAMDVFARRGFRGGGLAEVATLVDMTPAGILYHFGSKEALLLAVIQERDRRSNELDLRPEFGLESLRGLVRIAELCEAQPGLATLHTVLQIENLEPEDPAYKYFHVRTKVVQKWIQDTIETAQAAGDVRADVDSRSQALEIVAYMEGASVLWLLNPHMSLVDLYTTYLDALLERIVVKPGRPRRTATATSQPAR